MYAACSYHVRSTVPCVAVAFNVLTFSCCSAWLCEECGFMLSVTPPPPQNECHRLMSYEQVTAPPPKKKKDIMA